MGVVTPLCSGGATHLGTPGQILTWGPVESFFAGFYQWGGGVIVGVALDSVGGALGNCVVCLFLKAGSPSKYSFCLSRLPHVTHKSHPGSFDRHGERNINAAMEKYKRKRKKKAKEEKK